MTVLLRRELDFRIVLDLPTGSSDQAKTIVAVSNGDSDQTRIIAETEGSADVRQTALLGDVLYYATQSAGRFTVWRADAAAGRAEAVLTGEGSVPQLRGLREDVYAA